MYMNELTQKLIEGFTPLHPQPVRSLFLIGKSSIEGTDAAKNIPVVGIILKQATTSDIRLVKPTIDSFLKKGILFPYVFTQEFLESSLDSFPLEFLEFQAYHRMLIGESPFAMRTPDVRHVRLQCERELKGKSLHLKSALLNVNDAKKLREIMFLSRQDINRISLGMLVLKGVTPPSNPDDAVPEMARLYGTDRSLVMKLVAGDVSVAEAEKLFDSYVEMLDKLSDSIE
jgi:hypothetical protein